MSTNRHNDLRSLVIIGMAGFLVLRILFGCSESSVAIGRNKAQSEILKGTPAILTWGYPQPFAFSYGPDLDTGLPKRIVGGCPVAERVAVECKAYNEAIGQWLTSQWPREGVWEYRPPGSKKLIEGHFAQGVRQGSWSVWDTNGALLLTGQYEQGKKEGVWNCWYPSGAKAWDATFRGGDEISVRKSWDPKGELLK